MGVYVFSATLKQAGFLVKHQISLHHWVHYSKKNNVMIIFSFQQRTCMDLFLTDFSNGYHLSSKGIKRFLEMPIGAEKKSQATDNRLKKSFI